MAFLRLLALLFALLVVLVGCPSGKRGARTVVAPPPPSGGSGGPATDAQVKQVDPPVVAWDSVDPRTGMPQTLLVIGRDFDPTWDVVVNDPATSDDPILASGTLLVDDTRVTAQMPPIASTDPRRVQVAVQDQDGGQSVPANLFVGAPDTVSIVVDTPSRIYPGQNGVKIEAYILNTTGDPVEIVDASLEFDDPKLRAFLADLLPVTINALSFGVLQFNVGALQDIDYDQLVTGQVIASTRTSVATQQLTVETSAEPRLQARGGPAASGGAVLLGGFVDDAAEYTVQVGRNGVPVPTINDPGGTALLSYDLDQEPAISGPIVFDGGLNVSGFGNDPDDLLINAGGPVLASGSSASSDNNLSGGFVLEDFSGMSNTERYGRVGDLLIVKTGPNAGTYEITSFSDDIVFVSNVDGSFATIVPSTVRGAWCIKRRRAVLQDYGNEIVPTGFLDGDRFSTDKPDANFGGLAEGDQLWDGNVGDLLILRLADVADTADLLFPTRILRIAEVISASEVRVVDALTGEPPAPELSGVRDWRTEYVVKVRTDGDFAMRDARIGIGAGTDSVNLLISAGGDVAVLDSTIDLSSVAADGTLHQGSLFVEAGGVLRCGSAELTTRPSDTATVHAVSAGPGGGWIFLYAESGATLGPSPTGASSVIDVSGGDVQAGFAPGGGWIRLQVARGNVEIASTTRLRANGGSQVDPSRSGFPGAGGAIEVRAPGSRVSWRGRGVADGGTSVFAGGAGGGWIDIEGADVRVHDAGGDTVVDASGGAGTTAGGAGGLILIDTKGGGAWTGDGALLAIGGHGATSGGQGGAIFLASVHSVDVHGNMVWDASGGGVTNTTGAAGTRGGDATGDVPLVTNVFLPDPATALAATTTDTTNHFARGPRTVVVKFVDNPAAPTAREFALALVADDGTAILTPQRRGLLATDALSGSGFSGALLGGIHVLTDGPIDVGADAVLRARGGSPIVNDADLDPDRTEAAGGRGGTVRLYSDQDGQGLRGDLRAGPLSIQGVIDADGGTSFGAPGGNARVRFFGGIEMGIELAGEDVEITGRVNASGGYDASGKTSAGSGGLVTVRSFDYDFAEPSNPSGDGRIDMFDSPSTPTSWLRADAGQDQPGAFGGTIVVTLDNQLGRGTPNGGTIELDTLVQARGEGGSVLVTTVGAPFGTVFFPTAFANVAGDATTVDIDGTVEVSRSGRIEVQAEGDDSVISVNGALIATGGPVLIKMDQDDDDARGTIEIRGDVTVSGSDAALPFGFVSFLNQSDDGVTRIAGTVRVHDAASGNGGLFDVTADGTFEVRGVLDASGTTGNGGTLRIGTAERPVTRVLFVDGALVTIDGGDNPSGDGGDGGAYFIFTQTMVVQSSVDLRADGGRVTESVSFRGGAGGSGEVRASADVTVAGRMSAVAGRGPAGDGPGGTLRVEGDRITFDPGAIFDVDGDPPGTLSLDGDVDDQGATFQPDSSVVDFNG